ncbi:MAG: DUF4358 domain-containing protein [Clostridiales Family XIII bacterium]|jgi:hypothetical protein|nr:DUF4358 domain-containing protein [Clostridiales Family XIII bacterium]
MPVSPRGRAGGGAIQRFVSLAIALLCAFTLAGCGGAGNRAEAELDMRRLAEALLDGIAFDDQMEEASDGAFYALYAVDPSDESVAGFVLYTSTGATAEEVAIIEARDAADAPAVLEVARARVAWQKAEFEDYAPGERAKLNDPVLMRAGRYVILCLSNDNAAAERIIEDFIE